MKKRGIALVICAAMVLLMLAGCVGGAEQEREYARKAVQMQLNAKDGLIYRRSDGELVYAPGKTGGIVTPDENHILLLSRDGISITDGLGLGEKNVCDQENYKLLKVYDQSAVYCVEQGGERQYYRYTYQNAKSTALGEAATSKWVGGESDSSLLLALSDGSLWAFGAKGKPKQLEEPGSAPCTPVAISNDGSQCVWMKENSVFYFDGKSVGQYETALGEEPNILAYFNPKEKLIVILNGRAQSILFQKRGKPAQVVSFADEIANTNIIVATKYGNILQGPEGGASAFYLSGPAKQAKDERILYYVTSGGQKQKILEFGSVYTIQNEKIYFIDREGNLCSARLDGPEVLDTQVIDQGAVSISVSADGSMVCYGKHANRSAVGDLYCAKWGQKGEFIDENIYLRAVYVELEGDCFVYIKEPYIIPKGDGDQITGMLMWAKDADNMRMLTEDCVGILQEYKISDTGVKSFKKGELKFAGYSGYRQSEGLVCDYLWLTDRVEVKKTKEQILIY